MVVQRRIKEFILNQIEEKLNEQGAKNDIMPGLVPIGDTGLYGSSLEPVSPFDCARYPDSPYCGGFPIAFEPFQFSPEIIKDDCNIGIRINQTVGFIKFPPLALVYRYPECRKLPPKPLPASDNYSVPVYIPPTNCHDSNSPNVSIVFRDRLSSYEIIEDIDGEGNIGRATQTESVSITQFDFPVAPTETKRLRGLYGAYDAPVVGYITAVRQGIFRANAAWLKYYWLDFDGVDKEFPIYEIATHKITYSEGDTWRLFSGFRLGEIYINKVTPARFSNNKITSVYGHRGEIGSDNGVVTNYEEEHYTALIKCGNYSNSNRNNPAPPLQEEPCCMKCCPPHDTTLDKLLLKKLNKIYAILGGDDWAGDENTVNITAKIESNLKAASNQILDSNFNEKEIKVNNIIEYLLAVAAVSYKRAGYEQLPAELPKRLIYPNAKGEEKIDSLVELLGYQVKQLDRAVGYLPQKIRIADTNPGKPGNQPIEVEIHSITDALKEILQYLIDTEGDVDVTNNMLVRTLYELGFIHQGVVQADAMLDAICDHLDFKQRWKKVKVPFAFDPYAGTKGFNKKEGNAGADAQTEEEIEKLLPQMLQNTDVDIRVLVNDEKKSLNDLLQDIKRDTAAAAAAVSEKATPERLDQLVAAAQMLVQLQGAIDRKNSRQALSGGDLRTDKKR